MDNTLVKTCYYFDSKHQVDRKDLFQSEVATGCHTGKTSHKMFANFTSLSKRSLNRRSRKRLILREIISPCVSISSRRLFFL